MHFHKFDYFVLTYNFLIRSMGLAMAELLNAKERDLDEWKILLKNADENFDFIGMEQPKDSKLYFIEARWNLSKLKSLSLLETS